MSGYNSRTGLYELTMTKAGYWFRRKRLPEGFKSVAARESMQWYADLLSFFGHEVVSCHGTWLEVRATEGALWEALSGQPSRR